MRKTAGLGAFLASVFTLAEIVGGHSFGWMDNSRCFAYLGCNAGFFGYDAILHFLSGMTEIVFILWLAKKFPKFNFLKKTFWKNFIILIALVALLGVSWEFLEFGYDHVRMDILHQDLLHPTNRLRQPSNSDTMGDLFFGLLGAAVMITILELSDRKYIAGSEDKEPRA